MKIVSLKNTLLFAAALSAAACKVVREDDERKPIARVLDSYLYEDDIQGMTNGMSPQDSTVFIDNFIYNWGKEQLLISRAEYNLREDQKEFEEMVTQYRNDLIKFTYLEKYVNEHIDTAISEQEIVEYYNAHSADFELKENILKTDHFRIDKDERDISKAKYWWRHPSDKNNQRFMEYASIFAKEKSVGDTTWVRYSELSAELPLPNYNQQGVLNNKRLVLEDSTSLYFVAIHAFKIKEDVSPLAYVRPTVKSIILNKRKLTLIKKMEQNLVEDAFNKQDFEIY